MIYFIHNVRKADLNSFHKKASIIMNYFSSGIVLQKYPTKQQVLVLDYHLGKTYIHVPNTYTELWSCGSILRYSLIQKKRAYLFNHVEIDQILITPSYESLYFIHQILEIYILSLPEAHSYQHIVDEFHTILKLVQLSINKEQKVLSMLRIFWHTGLYTERAIKQNKSFIEFFALPIELMFAHALQCNYDELLHCVKLCIAEHPLSKKFKLCTVGLEL